MLFEMILKCHNKWWLIPQGKKNSLIARHITLEVQIPSWFLHIWLIAKQSMRRLLTLHANMSVGLMYDLLNALEMED